MKPSEQQDLYQRLNLEPNATADEIKQAYRQMAFEWHPDRNPNDPSLHEEFIAVSQAYEVLSDYSQRAEYDIKRARAQPKKPVTTSPIPRPAYQPVPNEYKNSNGSTIEDLLDLAFKKKFSEDYSKEYEFINKNFYKKS